MRDNYRFNAVPGLLLNNQRAVDCKLYIVSGMFLIEKSQLLSINRISWACERAVLRSLMLRFPMSFYCEEEDLRMSKYCAI